MATIVLLDADDTGRRLAELTLQQDGHAVYGFRDARSLKAAADSLPAPQVIVGTAIAPEWLGQLSKAVGWQAVPLLLLLPPATAPAAAGGRTVSVLETPYALADLRATVRRLL
jgi:DNA-binding NtrC family response regulator